MKNMKIKGKLLFGFILVALLASITGGLGIWGLNKILKSNEDMYNNSVVAFQYLVEMSGNIQAQRTTYRDAMLYLEDETQVNNAHDTFLQLDATFRVALENYGKTCINSEDEALLGTLTDLYLNTWMAAVDNIDKGIQSRDIEYAKANLQEAGAAASAVVSAVDDIVQFNIRNAEQDFLKDTADSQTIIMLQTIVMTVAVGIALIFGIVMARSISIPINKLADAAHSIAQGNIDVDIAFNRKDEMGLLSIAFNEMVAGIQQQVALVGAIAKGDLTVEVPIRSEHDAMSIALKQMLDSNNKLFTEIEMSSANVSRGAASMSSGSQMLAQGATEQAASVEELSSSIADIAKMTRNNAEMALTANGLAKNIMDNAEKGNEQMGHMMSAVQEINSASQSISKVIKAIDDIAFQTNILALNAAVEAARAGQHGKGFAVVADEVRSLAGKSAEAAKDTADLIANSIDKAELGSRIAAETAASLKSIVEGINESSVIISEIATYSNDQATAIDQVNKGIDQVAQVVQANSATSQQSAASASEMADQATHLTELLSRFKLRDSHTALPPAQPAQPRNLGAFDAAPYQGLPTNDGFGKY